MLSFIKRYTFIEWMIVLCIVGILVAIFTGSGKDDTDPADGRSGLRLFVDNRTGCHYLGVSYGGLTPRLDEQGRQICGGK